jgi:hypothetical protein
VGASKNQSLPQVINNIVNELSVVWEVQVSSNRMSLSVMKVKGATLDSAQQRPRLISGQ